MMGARVLVSRAVRVARRTRQPLSALRFGLLLRLGRRTIRVPSGWEASKDECPGTHRDYGLLASVLPAASPVCITQKVGQTLPIAIYKSV